MKKAEADYRGAARLAHGAEPLHDLVCFHCQQSAEKYLKALFEEVGQRVPRTHDLDALLTLLGVAPARRRRKSP
ncbi:MAG: HEPN domain-containing protein [Planctomycetia bacterium]|nr:HEPN domain-containing protein [Planctomycetia bacterium]